MPKAERPGNAVQRSIRDWLTKNSNTVEEDDFNSHLRVWSSEEFAAADFTREWLVTDILVQGQPGVVGGPRKGLKTSVVCDLVLSLGSGRPFLNYPRFSVPRRFRVGFFSGKAARRRSRTPHCGFVRRRESRWPPPT